MLNAGQICLAPDYVFVPRESEAAVVAGFQKAVSEMYPTLLANPDFTSVVNDRHHVRLAGYLDDARAKGGACGATSGAAAFSSTSDISDVSI